MRPSEDPVWRTIPQEKRPFTRVEPWLTFFGVLASLSGSEAKVLVVLCFKADNITAIARPTITEIARLAGVARSYVPRLTEALEMAGLIKARRFGNRQEYRILEGPPDWVKERKWIGKQKVFRVGAFSKSGTSQPLDFDPTALEPG